jgi:hypothetical protein
MFCLAFDLMMRLTFRLLLALRLAFAAVDAMEQWLFGTLAEEPRFGLLILKRCAWRAWIASCTLYH